MASQSTMQTSGAGQLLCMGWTRSLAHFALAVALGTSVGFTGPTAALAQPAAASTGKTSAKPPSAATKKEPKAKAGAASSASPPVSPSQQPPNADPRRQPSADANDDSAMDELPPGHPPVGTQLPSGHPPIEPQKNKPERASAHESDRFDPPENFAQDDPTLPVGVIVITVKDADDRPIAGAPVTLGILHSTVARGESRERRAGQADSEGSLRFDGLATDSSTTYRVTTTRGPATFAVMPFSLSDKAGKRVVVHAYDVSTSINNVLVGMQGIVYLQLREDSISVEHLFQVFNVGRVAWVPSDVVMSLPEKFKAFNQQQMMSDIGFDEVKGRGVALRGTFEPGRHDLSFRYQVPLTGDERQSIRLGLLPHVAQMRVMAEASKSMQLQVLGFPEAERVPGRDRKRILITERAVNRGEGGLKTLDISLSGLPTQGPGRWIAALLAAAAVSGAVAYVVQRNREGGITEEALQELREAREALLGELVELERAHQSGQIGPKTYARLRAALTNSLARIVSKLDEARGDRAARRKRLRDQRERLADSP